MERARRLIVVPRNLRYLVNPNPNPPFSTRIRPSPTVSSHQDPIFTRHASSHPAAQQPPNPSQFYDRNPNPNRLRSLSRSPSSNRMPSLTFHSQSLPTSARTKHRPVAPSIGQDQLVDIVETIRGDADDMERKLDGMSLRPSQATVAGVLRALNCRDVSALRFFNWLLNHHPGFCLNTEIYNQVIDNLGRFDDYSTLFLMLIELSSKGHCLTEKAFSFLTTRGPSGRAESVGNVIETLNRVGGSCRGSGIHSLIKKLCSMSAFDLAVFVMQETVRKTSYYNVFIAAKCRKGDFQGARDVFDEMRRSGCDPSTNSYNYLLGSLFKNGRVAEACDLMEVMEQLGYLPDAVTLEVVAYHACKANKMDVAIEFLDRMMVEGVRPRRTTHAAFVKGYFWSGRVEDAHKYVVDMITRDKCSGNMNYSLLANLYLLCRRVVEAFQVLNEMMGKGLRPNFPVYMKVRRDLLKMNRSDLASKLKSMFVMFNSGIDAGG